MTVELQQNIRTAEGTPRIALDEGARAQVSHDIEAARTQFTAAVESLMRTERGENTVAGGTASITEFGGTSKHNVFSAARDIINSLVGNERSQTPTTSKPGYSR